jgi:methionyl-tRNA formyltransferase
MARLVFLGTPPAAVAPLEALVGAGHDVALVVSRPETRRGRGPARTPSPVAAAARRLGLEVTDRLTDVVEVGAELGVVVAYGRIVPAAVLDATPMVNVHFSLLPRWRGAAPVERAILAGDTVTGVCIMRLEAGLDTGPVLARRELSMDDEHAGVLTERLSRLGAEMLVELLLLGVGALGPGAPQQGDATYADKIEPDDLRLDWSRSAAELRRVVRLDRAWTVFRGKRLRVLDAAVGTPFGSPSLAVGAPGSIEGASVSTGEGLLELVLVQPEGRRPMIAADWVRGARPAVGEILGDEETPR